MSNSGVLIFFLGLLVSCTNTHDTTDNDGAELIDYVNPFVGTGGHGHTHPAASAPYGMIQLGPDTRLEGWDGCSGYHYTDAYIYGFSHTHLSGTGISDYGDVLLMPTDQIVFHNGSDGQNGYRAPFSHEREVAEPGYYKVHLDSIDIEVELTVSQRSGMHKYQFPSSDNQHVILDLVHRDKVLDAEIQRVSDTEITGYRHSEAWARDQRVFFALETSHPFAFEMQSAPRLQKESGLRCALTFDNPDNEPILIKVGLSAVDIEGAKKNLTSEIGDRSFDQIKILTQESWEEQLQKITIESSDPEKKTLFYTALYHTLLAPNLYQDVDGRYRGMDLEIHETQDFEYYTVFSLWDTYRAAHPLYTLIDRERTNDFVQTFLAKYAEGGRLPMWDLSANYTDCMIGYHAVPVIADAYLKGIREYDADLALESMKHSAMLDRYGLEAYKKYGFIPIDQESESVSKTLEYAYDDWTIAQMAKSMGKMQDYQTFLRRAQYYKNVYDPETKFMRGRFKNTWFEPFDPYEVNFNYTEANAWQYSYYAPQDISGFMDLMGGPAALEKQLDSLFLAKAETSGRHQADITGLIGQYAHGNEPSHHIAYLYNFVGKPHKTQERVHQILKTLYTNTPDGISGNEDCGQMSAWYIFSAMGFYPVTPASNQFIIGTPMHDVSTIHQENGKSFSIEAHGLSDKHLYIESAYLNGKPLTRSYLTHDEIVQGGQLDLFMSESPSDWATKEKELPVTKIDEHLILPCPYIEKGDIAFRDSTVIILNTVDEDSEIWYTLDDGLAALYSDPLVLREDATLHVYAQRGAQRSPAMTTEFHIIDPNLSISLGSVYSNQYSAGGNDALIDGIRSTRNHRTGSWQGYFDTDFEATVDLGAQRRINSASINFLQDQRAWIFYPTEVNCSVSKDGRQFTPVSNGVQKLDAALRSDEIDIKTITWDNIASQYRYIRIEARTLGDLPEWHLGHPVQGKSWLFVDEISVDYN